MNQSDKMVTAALRVHSTTLDAQQIAGVLQTAPTSMAVMGEPLSPKNPKSALCASHLWVLDSGLDSTVLEDHIMHLLDFVEQKLALFQVELKHCQVDIFCGYAPGNEQGSIIIDAILLRRLSSIPLDLIFDIYT